MVEPAVLPAITFEGEEEEEELQAISPQRRKIFTLSQSPSVFDFNRRRTHGTLVLRPGFQRRKVWDDKKSSRFIESLLLDVPLPLIFLGEEADGTQVVIDGQQRLHAVFRFYDNQFPLRDLKAMREIERKRFKELDWPLRTKIEQTALPVVLITKETDPQIKFDVFERLNTGAVQLSAQELRNCIHRGSFNNLLNKLSTNATFQELLGFPREGDPRMKDVELVLRFFAFYHTPPEAYRKPMKKFLDDEMTLRGRLSESEERDLRAVFSRTIRLVNQVFGDKAFRRYDATPGRGHWRTTPNVALYEIIAYAFAKRLDKRARIVQMADSIREALIVLLSRDDEFNNAIDQHTSDEDRVQLRFRKWVNELDEIIGGAVHRGPRLFSLQLKQALFAADATCGICSQHIHDIDDAEIDHIEPFWKGGRTIPENARLAHRYCNRARSRSSSS